MRGVKQYEARMKTEQLLERRVKHVAVLPGGGWLVPGEKEATVTLGEPGKRPRTLAVGGSKLKYGVVAFAGLDAHSLVLSDGIGVAHAEFGDTRTMKRKREWTLPGELGWNVFIDATPDGSVIVVASDLRVARLGAEEKVILGTGDFKQHFRAVALLPGSRKFVVGRGDGHVEVRDTSTLEVSKRWPVGQDAVLALCALDEKTVAVATDDARTQLLNLETGELTGLPLARMKTAGLHRHADGRLVVVGLSRRITVFNGLTKVREADLSAELGDRYIQASALDGDTLLLACEERGLHSVRLSDFPESVEPVAFSRPPEELRADTQKALEFTLFNDALAAKKDFDDAARRVLQHNDEGLLQGVFFSLARANLPLASVNEHLRSPLPRVRYYAADHYGELPALFASRFEELKPVLADEDASVVAAAAWSLGRIGNVAAVEWVLPLLKHDSQAVRATAASTLLGFNAGHAEIVQAIDDGSGDLTFTLLAKFFPQANTSLLLPVPADVADRVRVGISLEALLRALDVEKTADFSANDDEPLIANPRLGALCLELLHTVALPRRWACTFNDARLRLTGHAAAAEWWKGELARRFPRS